MNVCFFGSYNREYARNKILIDGLQKNGVGVYHCSSSQASIFTRYPELIRQFWPIRRKIDVLYVAFVGHLDVPLAWILARITGKKVIFDMFYSMYDTYVFDRQSAKPESLAAWSYMLIDWLAASLADAIITDTIAHGKYFQKLYRLNPQKFRRIFVGGDDTIFKPFPYKKRKKIIIEYHGMFTRLSGAEYFIEAAKILEHARNLEFWLIGSSTHYFLPTKLYKKLKPKTMKYIPSLPVAQLARKIARADITIGHIGSIQKARNVISNKTFHGLACGNSLIVGDTLANRELLDSKTATFVHMSNSKDLVKKILYLSKRENIRKTRSRRGLLLFNSQLTNKHLGAVFLHVCTNLLSSI